MSSPDHPFLSLVRLARTVCNDELADLTARVPPLITPLRREGQLGECEILARQATEFAGRQTIPLEEWEPRLRAFTASLLGVMNGLGRSWWPDNPEDAIGATRELRRRMEACQEAGNGLLRLAQYYGC